MLARGLVLAGLLLGTLAAPAFADNTLTLSSGSTAVAVQGPNDSSAFTAVACSPVVSGWASPISGTSWIGRTADCSSEAAGSYTYTVTFTVPSGATGLQLSGSVMADDSVTVNLNSHQLFSGGGWTGKSLFNTTDGTLFNTGTNTLTFVVPNSNSGASGLDFQINVSSSNVTPTAANPNVTTNGQGEGRGACVSAAAHAAHGSHGHGAGPSVSASVHACGFGPAATAAHSDDTDTDGD